MKVVFTVSALLLLVALAHGYGDFTGKDWQAKSAADKARSLWKAISADDSTGAWPSKLALAGIFIEDMGTTMDTEADEMPYQYLQTTRREKLIHSVGATARIRYVPEGETSNFSGLFKGAQYGFTRCSLAKEYDGKEYTPGCGVKFLRDGKKSANFVAMYSLTGQDSWNFFKNDFSNHVPDLTDDSPTAQKLLKKKFQTASAWPQRVGLSDMAAFDQSGKAADKVKYPFALILQPDSKIRQAFGDKDTQDHIKQLVSFGSSGKWTTLWHVHQVTGPNGKRVKIGTIDMYSHFVTSKFADSEMFFQHQRIEDDLKAHPDWTPQ